VRPFVGDHFSDRLRACLAVAESHQVCAEESMSEALPRSISRPMQFQNGCALGISNRWHHGQYCSILTRAGIVGCGIYDVRRPAEFDQAIAIAQGTPREPLVEPEDLLQARIVDATPRARAMGIENGMTGREAVERMLMSAGQAATAPQAARSPRSHGG
jgi:uncharacterized protein YunC (DUF1805 family)